MFGREGKIKRAIEASVRNALAGDGDDAFAPIDALRDDEKVEAYVDACHQLIFEENLAAAAVAVDRALALAPDELYVLDTQAQLALERDQFSRAVEIYRRMHELAPDDPGVLTGLAELLLRSDDAAGAIALLEPHAASANPELELKLGEALYAADRAREADMLLAKVQAYYAAALQQLRLGDDPRELRRRFDEATELRQNVLDELHGGEPSGDDS
jgi:predicted Zn-dependent protease